MGQDAALARMESLIPGIVCIGGWVDEGLVELGLAHIGLEAIYGLEGRVRVEGETIGTEADNFAVLFVVAPELQVSVALPGMVQLVSVGDLRPERAWVLG